MKCDKFYGVNADLEIDDPYFNFTDKYECNRVDMSQHYDHRQVS